MQFTRPQWTRDNFLTPSLCQMEELRKIFQTLQNGDKENYIIEVIYLIFMGILSYITLVLL